VAKSLKDQYRSYIWFINAFNSVFLYTVAQADAIELAGLRAIFSDIGNLVPVGIAVVIATVLNGVLSPTAKARLVFLRWRDALPGYRAFSHYGQSDPRIDPAKLRAAIGQDFPTIGVDQNRMWYRLYRTVESESQIVTLHRDFLLTRDYASLSILFLVFYGSASLYAIPFSRVAITYICGLVLQYVLTRQAAVHYGVRLVTTVLAIKGG
jgi:hypothetical protein